MFSSPPSPPRFRRDSWSPDYGPSVDIEETEEEQAARRATTLVDPYFETLDWSVPRPMPLETPAVPSEIVFIDGTQRILMGGQMEYDGAATEAILASVAVGAVICREGQAEIVLEEPESVRFVIATAGDVPMVSYDVPCGSMNLCFKPISPQSAEALTNSPAPRQILSGYRAEVERLLASNQMAIGRLVVVDGRLPRIDSTSSRTPIIGMSKSHTVRWLAPNEQSLLPQLAAGQRSPVFRITDEFRSRLSWYLRLPHVRSIDHSLAGIVRIETPVMHVDDAVALAELTTVVLPGYASEPQHDRRAPQNLIPVGALEQYLRHEMGDALWIERCIEDYLYELG